MARRPRRTEPNPRWLDIGGGEYPQEGYTNVDMLHNADIKVNFETDRLPFDDNTISKFYSSHTLEHVSNVFHLLQEITRVGMDGSLFMLKVPHFTSPSAMCPGHVHVIGPEIVKHFVEFTDKWIYGKWIRCREIQHVPSSKFADIKEAFALPVPDLLIATSMVGACHEIVYHCSIENIPKGWTREKGIIHNAQIPEYVKG
jgi:hypothetical protein